MSLKSILERVTATPDIEFELTDRHADMRPVAQELGYQLREWRGKLPTFLDWSPQPQRGSLSPVATRLKLTYWLAKFSLYRPLITRVLADIDHPVPFRFWSLFHDALGAGFTLIQVLVSEDTDINVLLGHQICGIIGLLKKVVTRESFRGMRCQFDTAVLDKGIKILSDQLANESEWIRSCLRNSEV